MLDLSFSLNYIGSFKNYGEEGGGRVSHEKCALFFSTTFGQCLCAQMNSCSLFYLTTVFRHFPPPHCGASWWSVEWATLI